MRYLVSALALLCALPASAEAPSPELARASHALAAIWRPIAAADVSSREAAETACRGAIEEMAAIDAALPPVITPESLLRVRALRGLLIVPAEEDPGGAYFFPNAAMAPWFTSGLGIIAVLSEPEGLIGVSDAGGHQIALQLGSANGRAILRLRGPTGAIYPFVGCAPSLGAASP
jgi:hypothetical protein